MPGEYGPTGLGRLLACTGRCDTRFLSEAVRGVRRPRVAQAFRGCEEITSTQRPRRPQRKNLSKRCFARFAIFAFNVILSQALRSRARVAVPARASIPETRRQPDRDPRAPTRRRAPRRRTRTTPRVARRGGGHPAETPHPPRSPPPAANRPP